MDGVHGSLQTIHIPLETVPHVIMRRVCLALKHDIGDSHYNVTLLTQHE